MKGKDSCWDVEMWKGLCFHGTTFTFPAADSHTYIYYVQTGRHRQCDKCIEVLSLSSVEASARTQSRQAWMHALMVNKCACKCTDPLCYVVKNISIDTHSVANSKHCYKMNFHVSINHQSSPCKQRCRIMVQFTLILLHIETFHTV